ncbi:DUF2264 domain-containing protein [Streptomyces beijiangensis]|uniref:DUF2264 domain-containing protein n=1 Tax=Streptomyces beijiangensis TaxID=163361 RepID=A0A939FCS0_9ACTN|nr:DUF2264 domain-containing protein [Streptomyces beijiangensis]MBO0516232.1 DUF2264 domain-containing protein [Streptomyces beijiangensis]
MRRWLQGYVTSLAEPLLPHFSEGRARLRLGVNTAIHDDTAAELEAFARPLWGLAPLAAGGGTFEHWEYWVRGLAAGTDPRHPEYWGEPGPHGQRIVEMAAIGFALALAPEKLWDPLTGPERERVAHWLRSALDQPTTANNWLFFPVLISLGLDRVGVPYDRETVRTRLDRLETFSLGDGWYADGPTERRDYYVPWSLHFYGLLYAALAGDRDPERAVRFRMRASLFARDFQHWFADDGSAVPYGRSLTYRFAQAAYWGALPYAGVEALPWGVVKGHYLRHLRWWRQQPITTPDGLLSIGYGYPQPALAEQYNAPGSPYWALKTFLPLALPDSHPFWTAPELTAPALPPVTEQPHAGAVLMRSGGDVTLLAGRQHHSWVRHGAEKYAKFAYSTRFGFSVPAGPVGAEQGAYDSMLALSEDGDHFRVREEPADPAVAAGTVRSTWHPWPDVEITTWLTAAPPWHLRVHRIRTARHLHTAEGGFAVDRDGGTDRRTGAARARIASPAGLTGLIDSDGRRTGETVDCLPGTNVLARRTALPLLTTELPPGEHWLRCAVLGTAAGPEGETAWKNPPAPPVPKPNPGGRP